MLQAGFSINGHKINYIGHELVIYIGQCNLIYWLTMFFVKAYKITRYRNVVLMSL